MSPIFFKKSRYFSTFDPLQHFPEVTRNFFDFGFNVTLSRRYFLSNKIGGSTFFRNLKIHLKILGVSKLFPKFSSVFATFFSISGIFFKLFENISLLKHFYYYRVPSTNSQHVSKRNLSQAHADWTGLINHRIPSGMVNAAACGRLCALCSISAE